MASKIFMGSMPELMEKILNNLHVNNEFVSLYSCTLVNRHWCKVSIPILWQNPFSCKISVWTNPLVISTYLSSFDENKKISLKIKYGLNIEISQPLFNYARFLKVLNLSHLETDVILWINLQLYSTCFRNDNTLKDDKVIKNLIINLLFKLFIESGAILHRFGVAFPQSTELNQVIFYSLERNEQFFSHLQKLSVGEISETSSESVIILLKILAKFTKKIITLNLKFCYDYDVKVFCALTSIIKSQVQIRKFKFCGGKYTDRFHGVISALECQKRSLREVTLDNCDYSDEFKVLSNCKNLEILSFNKCDYNLLNTLDNKISTLEITHSNFNSNSLMLFLKKSGNLLQRIIIISKMFCVESILLKGLKFFCPNIKYLSIILIEFSDQLLDLIKNLPNLQFLVLWIKDYVWEDEKLIKKFSEILSLTLQYFDLEDTTLNSYIDIWLNNCYTPLKNQLKKLAYRDLRGAYRILHTKKNLELFGYLIIQI